MTELKPCPFCGNKAIMYQDYNACYYVGCPKCWAESMHYPTDKDYVVKAWNRRVNNEHE